MILNLVTMTMKINHQKQINKISHTGTEAHIHTCMMEHITQIKMKDTVTHVTTWMNLEDIMLSGTN